MVCQSPALSLSSVSVQSTKKLRSQTPPRSVKLENMCIRYAQGGVWVWNWIVNSILPSPDSFSDWEDDASSIICFFCIVDWSIEKGEGQELHSSRRIASNISPCLGTVGDLCLIPHKMQCLELFKTIYVSAFSLQRPARIARLVSEYNARMRHSTICRWPWLCTLVPLLGIFPLQRPSIGNECQSCWDQSQGVRFRWLHKLIWAMWSLVLILPVCVWHGSELCRLKFLPYCPGISRFSWWVLPMTWLDTKLGRPSDRGWPSHASHHSVRCNQKREVNETSSLHFCLSAVSSPFNFFGLPVPSSLSLLCQHPINKATSKPNASTIREIRKYVHKICTGGGLGLELNC